MQKGLSKHDFYLFEGVNALREGNRLPANAVYYAENSRFSGGRWGSRKGYTAFGDSLTGGTGHIRATMPYERFPLGVADNHVVSYYNSKLYSYNLATTVATEIVAAGWTAGDVDIQGVPYNASLYMGNGVDRIGKLNDTAFSVLATGPRPYLLETWAEKMWAVEPTAPATVQYTLTATASSPSNIEVWTGAGTGGELIGKGGKLTALKTLNQEMYAFKGNEIEKFTSIDTSSANPVPIRSPISKNTGAVSQKSVVKVENDIWFLTPNLEIRSIGHEANYVEESRTKDMSSIIQRYKSTLDPDQSGAVAWYNNHIYKLALKERSSSQNNLVFVYDTIQQLWNFDRSTSPTHAVTIAGNSYFSVDGNSGQLYKDENGYSDNGFPMSWGGKTALVDDGRPDLSKGGRYMYVRGARSEGVVVTFYLLGEDFQRLETLTLPAPTAAEIATGAVADDWGQVGDIVGGEGYSGVDEGAPAVYRYNYTFSVSSTSRLFGIEPESSLNGQRAYLDEARLFYIPRPQRYNPINA